MASNKNKLEAFKSRLNPEMIGKKLSVEWTSVLMGYHPKWTELRLLETPLYPFRLEEHLKN